MTHHCHAPGCTQPVAARKFACRKHWQMVPSWLQKLLLKMYVRGQEIRKDPTYEYRLVQTRCRLEIARREGNTVAVRTLTADLGAGCRYTLTKDAEDNLLTDEQLIDAMFAPLQAAIAEGRL